MDAQPPAFKLHFGKFGHVLPQPPPPLQSLSFLICKMEITWFLFKGFEFSEKLVKCPVLGAQ